MLKRFMPREENFFGLFEASCEILVEATQEFERMMSDSPQKIEFYVLRIRECEHRADTVTHNTVALLHNTFITPLDREDIHQLISKLDDILDLLDAAAHRFVIYEVNEMTPAFKRFAEILRACAIKVQETVRGLSNLKNPEALLKNCIDLNRLENEADHVLRDAMARLFREEQDLKKLIKYKEIYEILESATDRCEDVANIVEGIVLEYA